MEPLPKYVKVKLPGKKTIQVANPDSCLKNIDTRFNSVSLRGLWQKKQEGL